MTYSSFVNIFFTVFLTLLGIVIGSFLNVVIYRTPVGKTIVKGHSMCMSCSHELAAKDLVPVFSWLFLKGKCRYCGAPVASRYCKIESLTGFVFLLATLFHLDSLAFFEILGISGSISSFALVLLVYHVFFLISCCMLISAMMIWYDTLKCFWRLPGTISVLILLAEIMITIINNRSTIEFMENLGIKIARLIIVPLISFVIYLVFKKKYTKNELTLDLTFGGIFLFTSYLMFSNYWIITAIFAIAFALLRVLSAGKKLERYSAIIASSVVVIYLVISYII